MPLECLEYIYKLNCIQFNWMKLKWSDIDVRGRKGDSYAEDNSLSLKIALLCSNVKVRGRIEGLSLEEK